MVALLRPDIGERKGKLRRGIRCPVKFVRFEVKADCTHVAGLMFGKKWEKALHFILESAK
jgi:hypothetical protein